jgi:predicted nuclease of predicted toxin-antitoxin system
VTLWIAAQLSPALAAWINRTFPSLDAYSVRALGLREASDRAIFHAAREAGAVVMTKDADFARLLDLHGSPPRVIWVTSGNTSNARRRELLTSVLPDALALLARGELLVEIRDLAVSP